VLRWSSSAASARSGRPISRRALTARCSCPIRGLPRSSASEIVLRLTERWLLVFGVLFVLVVFFFPRGVLGTIREALRGRRAGAA
jgi:ABC-type branched-subunit amino acid transport system permease subunit